MRLISQILIVAGSLGVFLYGMRLLSGGLQQIAGSRLQRILASVTSNRFAGVLSGFAITTIIQSSSATTVLVVGFVDATLLTLRQAIGVIFGANIGTTVTGWVVALLGFQFDITAVSLPAVGIGMVLLLSKRIGRSDIAEAFLGFGFLFLGLSLLKDSVPDIRNNPEVLQFLTRFTDRGFLSLVIFVIIGALLTIVVQSSSAAMTITITITFSGWIDFPTAAAIILGENIGTTATAFLASLDAGANAKRAARAHMLFNLFGVTWMCLLFSPFLSLVDAVVPGPIDSRTAITAHLAMFHTLFNVANTALCIGFVPLFERLVVKMVKEDAADRAKEYRLHYIRSGFQESVELNVIRARREVALMDERVESVFLYWAELFQNPSKALQGRQAEMTDRIELVRTMQEQITAFLVECSREPMGEHLATTVNELVRITHRLESVADTSGKLIRITAEWEAAKRTLLPELVDGVGPYIALVREFLAFNKSHLDSHLDPEQFRQAVELEQSINAMQKELKRDARRRLRTGASAQEELFYIDILRHVEHIGDYSLEISESLSRLRRSRRETRDGRATRAPGAPTG